MRCLCVFMSFDVTGSCLCFREGGERDICPLEGGSSSFSKQFYDLSNEMFGVRVPFLFGEGEGCEGGWRTFLGLCVEAWVARVLYLVF